MIASLTGQIRLIRHFVILEVAGVGYKLHVPTSVLEKLHVSDTVTIYTHQHVREDSLDLYGFLRFEEVELFERLLSVSGIGPKAGLALLSQFTVDDLQQSIAMGDTNLLTKVSGIGKKTAERLILELKGTLADVLSAEASTQSPPLGEALGALEQLGYSSSEALEALKQGDTSSSVEDQIRAALAILGR